MANANPSPATRFSETNQPTEPECNLSPLAQIRRLQRLAYQTAFANQTKPQTMAALMTAWERLEGRKAVLVGKPGSLTGRVEPTKPKRTRHQSQVWGPSDPSSPDAPTK